jgi:16S rRNA (guanine966-N2)-methyltransferase
VTQPSKNRPAKSPPRRSRDAEDEVVGVRIIGGKLRGRLLEYSGDMRTRPMKDRVREAVFNLVGPAIAGTHAIDLFAGTGALGLEALSRGATSATMIERHYPSSQLIKQNAQSLGIEEKCEVVFGDAFLWTRKQCAPQASHPASLTPNLRSQISNPSSSAPRWLVFCSPPYEFYVSRQAEMLELLSALWSTAVSGSLFVVEADERFDFGLLPEPARWDVRNYRPARIGVAEKQ